MAYNNRPTSMDELMSVPRDQKAEMVRSWIDDIPLSRHKKHVGRDLADAVIAAEIIRFYLPRLVEVHNYVPSHNIKQKTTNWKTLNRKVLSKLRFEVPDDMIMELVNSKLDVAEDFLLMLRDRIFAELEDQRRRAQVKANPTNSFLEARRHDSYDAALARARKRLVPGESDSSQDRHRQMSFPSLPPVGGQRHSNHVPSSTWPGGGAPALYPGEDSYDEVASARHEAPLRQHQNGTLGPRDRGWEGIGQDINIVLEEKEQTILELQETVQLMTVKVRRLEGLLRVKDLRIEDLTTRLQNYVSGNSPERPPRRKR